jgi:lysozyme family protein
MKKIFEAAFNWMIKHEGVYSNDFCDTGGETKYGISNRQYPNINIEKLTLQQAKEIYYNDFFINPGLHKLEDCDEEIIVRTFDFGVNAGTTNAIKILQRSARIIGHKLQDDGVIGEKTISVFQETSEKYSLKKMLVIAAFVSMADAYYRQIVISYPKNKKFLDGWLNRIYDEYKNHN